VKIAVFGASGNIGSQVVTQLWEKGHDVIRVSSHSGKFIADYTNGDAVEALLREITPLDAIIVSVGGDSAFKPYSTLTDEDFRFGAERKLIAQFRMVRLAEHYLSDNGSVTLTSGFLSHYPNPHSIATGPFNTAIDAFVQHTAPLLPRGLRLNVVSPAPVVEPARAGKGLVSAEQVARYYLESVTSNETGNVYRAWGGLKAPDQKFLSRSG
jgi:NAD(P)-dependent dehydrogenase (short-subunit alcohol dehydrogenase family)